MTNFFLSLTDRCFFFCLTAVDFSANQTPSRPFWAVWMSAEYKNLMVLIFKYNANSMYFPCHDHSIQLVMTRRHLGLEPLQQMRNAKQYKKTPISRCLYHCKIRFGGPYVML